MKTIHIAALLGGAAALYYVTQKKSNAVRHNGPTPTKPGGAWTFRTDPSGGKSCVDANGKLVPLNLCTDPASQLEGYFSTGAAPCCPNCAHGRTCSG